MQIMKQAGSFRHPESEHITKILSRGVDLKTEWLHTGKL